jgi:hypothetical protein
LVEDEGRSNLTHTLAVWSALTRGQLSVLAIWLVFRAKHDLWSWILPLGGYVAVSAIRDYLNVWGSSTTAVDYAARSALQMLLPIVVLWLLIRTRLWRKLSAHDAPRKWEFSLLQLLIWMTVVALVCGLIALTMRGRSGLPAALSDIQGILVPASLAVGCVLMAHLPAHWLLRLAAYLSLGAAAGAVMAAFRGGVGADRLVMEFMIEALVIAAWIEWGGIVGRGMAAATDTPQSTGVAMSC